MLFDIDNPGQYGIIKDVSPYELPNNAWSDGANVQFDDGYCAKRLGDDEVRDAFALSITNGDGLPYYLTPIRTDASYFWVYAGQQIAWITDMASKGQIYTGSNAGNQWTSGFLQGLLLMTNDGSDPPQSLVPALPSSTNDLLYDTSASTTWATAANTPTCNTLRTFKNYGVALDTTESGTRNSRRVWWSHPADAGAEPPTWDYTKPQFDAGQVELDDDPEPVIDCVPMRGDNLIYKYNSIYRMTEVGPPFIFGFNRIFNNLGIRSRNCVKEFFGSHAVFGFDDIILHDGQSHQKILDNKLKRWLINNIDETYSNLCQTVVYHVRNEIWFNFPEVGSTTLSKAVVWNWKDNTVGIRDLKNVMFMAEGIVDLSSGIVQIDSDTGTIDSATGKIDEQLYEDKRRHLLSVTSDDTFIYGDVGTTFSGSNYTAYVERQGIPILPDTNKLIFINRLYPRIEGAPVTIKLAEQMELTGPITWSTYTFDPSTDHKVDCRATTRVPGIWVGNDSGAQWRMHGITLGWEYAGQE